MILRNISRDKSVMNELNVLTKLQIVILNLQQLVLNFNQWFLKLQTVVLKLQQVVLKLQTVELPKFDSGASKRGVESSIRGFKT